MIESNLTNWDATEEAHHNAISGANNAANAAASAAAAAAASNECWETEKSIPLLFALLTRYLGGTDRLRCNAFEVRDATGNSSSGVIHCADAYSLTSWAKCITDVILGLNNVQVGDLKFFACTSLFCACMWQAEKDKIWRRIHLAILASYKFERGLLTI